MTIHDGIKIFAALKERLARPEARSIWHALAYWASASEAPLVRRWHKNHDQTTTQICTWVKVQH